MKKKFSITSLILMLFVSPIYCETKISFPLYLGGAAILGLVSFGVGYLQGNSNKNSQREYTINRLTTKYENFDPHVTEEEIENDIEKFNALKCNTTKCNDLYHLIRETKQKLFIHTTSHELDKKLAKANTYKKRLDVLNAQSDYGSAEIKEIIAQKYNSEKKCTLAILRKKYCNITPTNNSTLTLDTIHKDKKILLDLTCETQECKDLLHAIDEMQKYIFIKENRDTLINKLKKIDDANEKIALLKSWSVDEYPKELQNIIDNEFQLLAHQIIAEITELYTREFSKPNLSAYDIKGCAFQKYGGETSYPLTHYFTILTHYISILTHIEHALSGKVNAIIQNSKQNLLTIKATISEGWYDEFTHERVEINKEKRIQELHDNKVTTQHEYTQAIKNIEKTATESLTTGKKMIEETIENFTETHKLLIAHNNTLKTFIDMLNSADKKKLEYLKTIQNDLTQLIIEIDNLNKQIANGELQNAEIKKYLSAHKKETLEKLFVYKEALSAQLNELLAQLENVPTNENMVVIINTIIARLNAIEASLSGYTAKPNAPPFFE